jgi:hypothetical protein
VCLGSRGNALQGLLETRLGSANFRVLGFRVRGWMGAWVRGYQGFDGFLSLGSRVDGSRVDGC